LTQTYIQIVYGAQKYTFFPQNSKNENKAVYIKMDYGAIRKSIHVDELGKKVEVKIKAYTKLHNTFLDCVS